MQNVIEEHAPEIRSDLGFLKQDYRVAAGTLVMNLLLALVAVGVALALFRLGYQRWTAGEAASNALVPAGLGLVVLAVFAWLGYTYGVPYYQNRGLRVWVYDHGFVCLRRDRMSQCRWDEVTRVWQVIRKFGHGYWRWIEVSTRQGQKWVFDSRIDPLDDFGGLTEAIESEVARCMLPRARDDLRSGRPWHFGDLRMSRDGLEYGGESLPWDQFKNVSCDGLTISFSRRDGWTAWKKIATDQVPNIRLLLTLVRQLAGEFGRLSEVGSTSR